MELLTVDYFTFTTQQTHGHVNIIGGIKQTLSEFLMAHHGYAALAKPEVVKLVQQQGTSSCNSQPIV